MSIITFITTEWVLIHRYTRQKRYYDFLRNFCVGSLFKYREAITQQFRCQKPTITVDLSDIAVFDSELLITLNQRPDEELCLLESAAHDVLKNTILQAQECNKAFDLQIVLKSTQLTTALRFLTAEHVGRLLKVSGIIVSASKVKSKATIVEIQCTRCGNHKTINCQDTFASVVLPKRCDGDTKGTSGEQNECGLAPYVVISDDCTQV